MLSVVTVDGILSDFKNAEKIFIFLFEKDENLWVTL